MPTTDQPLDFQINFPVEVVIGQTPLSSQASNSRAKEEWRRVIGNITRRSIASTSEWYSLDDRPLMVTIYYFPPGKMSGDIDNIIKPILDGMKSVAYRDDNCIERVVAQKFEPGIPWLFTSPSSSLQATIRMEKPALYIRIEDNLAWREAA